MYPSVSPRSRIQYLKDSLSAPSACREGPNGVLLYKFSVKYRLLDRWRTLNIWAPSFELAGAGIDEMKSTLEVEGRLLK